MGRRPVRTRPDRGPRLAVTVQRVTRAARLPRGSDLSGWANMAAGSTRGELTARLVGYAESRRLNERFRGKARATNVLAFPAAAGPGAPAEVFGDLVICLPLVHSEALAQGKKPLHHLAHLVIHGTLHLLGYDHDRPAAARRMEAEEVRTMVRLGFPDPYRPQEPRTGRARPGRRT